MTREQLQSILQEGGIENPSKLMVNSILNIITEEKKALTAEVEATANEKYKGYKSQEDYAKLEKEIADLKDAGAKAERINKLKLKGISEKYIDYADSILKDSKNFDKDLEKYVTDYPEQFETKKPGLKTQEITSLGDTKKSSSTDVEWNNQFIKALGFEI